MRSFTVADAWNAGACIEGVAKFVEEHGGRIDIPVEELALILDEENALYVGLNGNGGGDGALGDGDGCYGDGCYGGSDGCYGGNGDGDGDGALGDGDGYGGSSDGCGGAQ